MSTENRSPESRNTESRGPQSASIASRKDELEKFEFMMGPSRGKLAVAMDMLTDAMVLVGQHGVYCVSARNPSKPAMDIQAVSGELQGAKELLQQVMAELRAKREE